METIQGSEPHLHVPGKPFAVAPLGYPVELISPATTYENVSDQVTGIALRHPHRKIWFAGFTVAFGLFLLFCAAVCYLFYRGVGIWGINIPVAWGFAITNFVWWIGIGHAGTFISAILLLLFQKWRTTINRFTEAMTLFAVMCAGIFPLLHLGRPWVFYFLLPYPDTMALWPQFRSPLVWDVFAVSTYFTVSLLFWYMGVVPDLATVRDKAQSRWKRRIYGIGALGWRGSAIHWKNHQSAYLLLGGLATPLVLSVHSVVSFDFSVAQLPGWHHLLRVCHGAQPDYSHSPDLRSGKLDHGAHAQQHGLRDVGHRVDGRLWLHHGGVHGLVQRRCVREGHDVGPGLRPLRLDLLGLDDSQRVHSPVALVQKISNP
jgi:molybdopterin-containing oxidoreductase family membrane subunit